LRRPASSERLCNEQIDAAFVRTRFADRQGLVVDLLSDEPLVVALPVGHLLAQSNGRDNTAISIKALAGETFIIQGSRFMLGLYAATVAACHAAGFTPRIGPEASNHASTLNLVAVGLGVSLVPVSLRRMHIDGVTYRTLKGPDLPTLPLDLASRRGDPSAVVRHFLKLVRQAAKDFQFDASERDIHRARRRK
jgi:DNA-binding transcriptional LysR family regulator